MNLMHALPAPLLNRRSFLATSAAAAAFTTLKPGLALGAEANSKIELGLIGFGGRGQWIADLFAQSGLYKIVACADYFQDRVDAAGAKHQDRSVTPLHGALGVQAPFRVQARRRGDRDPALFPSRAGRGGGERWQTCVPRQARLPWTPPGCLIIGDAGKRATAKKQVFLVDFQTRANEHYRKALAMVRNGDIGRIVMGEAHYPWRGGGRGPRPAGPEAAAALVVLRAAVERGFYCGTEHPFARRGDLDHRRGPRPGRGRRRAEAPARREHLGSFCGELHVPG